MAADATDFDYASATVPSGALFVAADEPLLVFPSVAAAEQYLEAVDVQDGAYPAAYGANGERYRIRSEGDQVFIELSGEPEAPGELGSLLIRYLEATGRAPDITATFDELVATVWDIESSFWREHDPYGERFSTRIQLWGCIGFGALMTAVLHFAFRWVRNGG